MGFILTPVLSLYISNRRHNLCVPGIGIKKKKIKSEERFFIFYLSFIVIRP